MRFAATIIAAFALAPSARAVDPPPPAAVLAALKPTSRMILRDADVPSFTVYEWERDGVRHNAWPGSAIEPPYDAARVQLKLYTFPTGQLRKLYFGAGQRTPAHLNLDDIILYSLGTSQAEVVGNDVFISHPGDASLHPAGVTHYSQTIVPGWRCEFAFKAKGVSGLDPVSLPGRDKAVHQATERVENGRRVVSYDAAATDGARFTVRMFQFPGYQLVEERLPKGEVLPEHLPDAERLLFVVSGRLEVRSGDERGIVGAGDMIREAPGRPFARRVLEDSVIVDLEGSQAP